MKEKISPKSLIDTNVVAEELLPTAQEIKNRLLLSSNAANTVFSARKVLKDILERKDKRLLVVVGPCSIHDTKAGREYATRLQTLHEELSETLFIVMRVYFSKPRTTVGWKGLINDPYLDDSFRIEEGLYIAREFLLALAEAGLPAGTEALDPIIPQYIDDLVSWYAIGARTAESQTHREMASGLSTPVGFKNGTDGNVQVAINALKSVAAPHHFLGVNHDGQCCVLRTRGNALGHIVLRGGAQPNYDSVSIRLCEEELKKEKLAPRIMVDCSHGNSLKNPAHQPLVFNDCINQIIEGNESIVGLMLESNLFEGKQELLQDRSKLRYGVSITDGCIDWNSTEKLLRDAHKKLAGVLDKRNHG